MPKTDDKWLDEVQFTEDGLVPAIAQEEGTGRVLMLAWMNREALLATLRSKQATYYSRSRKALWRKGETSGNTQQVSSIQLDCDGDAILLQVSQEGGIACHTGRHSCFYRELGDDGWQETEPVVKDPADIYAKEGQ